MAIQLPLSPQKELVPGQLKRNIGRLYSACSKNKKLPEGFELQALTALAYYPELAETNIHFKFRRLPNLTFSTRPVLSTVLRKASNRTYEISINYEVKEALQPVLLHHLPFELQVWVLGHELGHVLDFHRRSTLGLVKAGLEFLIPPLQKKAEGGTDKIAIEHGLGYQGLKFCEYVWNYAEKYPDEPFYRFYKFAYLSPAEFRETLHRSGMYK